MYPLRNYTQDAIDAEIIFRNILSKLEDLPIELSDNIFDMTLEDIISKCTKGNRDGKWTIVDFFKGPHNGPLFRLSNNEAIIGVQNVGILSGDGRVDKYSINSGNYVQLASTILKWVV